MDQVARSPAKSFMICIPKPLNDGAATFQIFERYTDSDVLQVQRDTAHYKAYRAKIMNYLSAPIGVTV